MASSSDYSSHLWAAEVQPSKGETRLSGAERPGSGEIEVLHPDCRVEGWFLPALGTEVQGMRLLMGKDAIAVKRRQIRPDILRIHPNHPEALLSGFKADLLLRAGVSRVQLQYKDAAKQWHDLGAWVLRLSKFWRLKNLWGQSSTATDYESWLAKYETPSAAELDSLRAAAKQLPEPPLISILLPVSGGSTHIRRTLESVQAQVYPHWELCAALDDSAHEDQVGVIEKAAWADPRLKIGQAEGPSACPLAEALQLSKGSWVAFLAEGDMLAPHALFLAAEQMIREPEAELIYSDEDEVDAHGKHRTPHLKGGWDRELLWSHNEGGKALLMRMASLRALGGLRPLPGSDILWDLLLRASARLPRKNFLHLPRLIYYQDAEAAAKRPASDIAARGKKTVQKHLLEMKTGAVLHETAQGGWRIVWPLPDPPPQVSIIIPTRNRSDLLRVAMDSLFAKTAEPPFEIIIVDHASDEAESLAYFQELAAQHANVRILQATGPFNWSRLNNLGAAQAKGDVLVFLNNDVEITEPHWLRELAAQALRPQIGAVGAMLLYPNGSIQHAGIVLGMTGLAGHVFRSAAPDAETLGGRPNVLREVTAVTGACLAVRRALFNEVGGFDEAHLPISYNDVDFCLKLRAQGLSNLYTPFARLIHHESVSRGKMEQESLRKMAASEEARVVLQRWPDEFAADAYFSPNLSLEHEIPELAAPPPRLQSQAPST